ncbi:ATP-binding protein [Microcoleus sp. PH2017_30_WIL_O_A]|uniref:ATP-binding protein n=1 Tax=Microcoleus sp. PH2017_30_WIL_O_A TaxID=2798840 RepID=UPI001DAE1042|nr:ATP-binding protein [Microcoleus sp. PH2017_30_WIL_O_A]MCC3585268.1 AAA family ATPase [Microcoleus sp. PH2017_30_WIL_O_A]
MAGIAASEAGIEKAKIALIDKGWSRKDLADRVLMGEDKSLKIGIDIQTVNNFFKQKRVSPQCFVGICKALGLDWQDITNPNTTTRGPETGFFHDNTSLQSIDSVKNPVSSIAVDNSNHNNPFIPQHGKIDNPRFFFGRQREIRRVFETLNGGSSVAIIGERAIGKSSLLQALYRETPTELRHPRQPIYLNLNNVYDEHDFYDALCGEAGIETVKGYQLKRALESHRFLLLLDEVEKMTWDGFTNQVRGQLRGLAEGTDAPLRLVVAACTSLDTLFPDSQDKNMTSPFKGICIEETLKQWDDQISRKFIASRLQADWLTPVDKPVSFTEAEIVELIAESNGYPQKLMQLCYQTYDRYLNDSKSP